MMTIMIEHLALQMTMVMTTKMLWKVPLHHCFNATQLRMIVLNQFFMLPLIMNNSKNSNSIIGNIVTMKEKRKRIINQKQKEINIAVTSTYTYVGKLKLRNLLFLRFNNMYSKTKSKHKDKDNNNRTFTKQIVNGLRTHVTPKTSESKPNNMLQGALPESYSTMHLLNKKHNFMMTALHELNATNKQHKITLKIDNDNFLHDHQSNNSNKLGGVIVGNNTLTNPSFLIATMPTICAFSSSNTSVSNSATSKNNRKRKNKN